MRFRQFLEHETTFDRNAEYWLGKKSIPPQLLSRMEPHFDKGYKVLDLGCGGGRLTNFLSKWGRVGYFDLIVSNCAIRKDYCPDLAKVCKLCVEHADRLIFRIQEFGDMAENLPPDLRGGLFYSQREIVSALPGCKMSMESYRQKFSSESYFRKFLERINIPFSGKIATLNPTRKYVVVEWEK